MRNVFTLFTLILLSHPLFATIHYTFVQDYISQNVQAYDLDLDGDNDFYFEDTSYLDYSYRVHTLKSTSFFAADGTTGSTPKAYVASAGAGTYHWENGTGELCNYDCQLGSFANGDKYLQVKFNSGSHTYYGWVRIITIGGNFLVGSYAYNDVPDEPITPGDQGTTGIIEIGLALQQATHVGPNGISFNNNTGFDKVMVTTVDGKMITTINNPNINQTYNLVTGNNMVIVSYFKHEELLSSNKFVVLQ